MLAYKLTSVMKLQHTSVSTCLLTDFAPVGICHSKAVRIEQSKTIDWKDRGITVHTDANIHIKWSYLHVEGRETVCKSWGFELRMMTFVYELPDSIE